jgi:hypothetical protein
MVAFKAGSASAKPLVKNPEFVTAAGIENPFLNEPLILGPAQEQRIYPVPATKSSGMAALPLSPGNNRETRPGWTWASKAVIL